jgi:transposase
MLAIPLYRQEKDWERLGYTLSRTTMANRVIRCSEDYFSRFVARLSITVVKQKKMWYNKNGDEKWKR